MLLFIISLLFLDFVDKMDLKHVLRLSSINEFFANDNKIIKKGENAMESNHVKKMQFEASFMIIKGGTSMKDKTYNVEVS